MLRCVAVRRRRRMATYVHGRRTAAYVHVRAYVQLNASTYGAIRSVNGAFCRRV